jgi:putative NIF3 family GTP cyclohydrolase 1 type 2
MYFFRPELSQCAWLTTSPFTRHTLATTLLTEASMIGLLDVLVITELDETPNFLFDYFEMTDFSSIRPVIPAKAPAGIETSLKIEKCGAGRFLELKGQISIEKAVEQVKQKLKLAHVHLAMGKGHTQGIN